MLAFFFSSLDIIWPYVIVASRRFFGMFCSVNGASFGFLPWLSPSTRAGS